MEVATVSYNGSGTFQINTTGQPVVTGTVISSTAFNALTADLATGLSTAITKDGQTATTARIPFAAGISSTLVTDSTSSSTGSIITAGGIGVAKAAYIGTTLNVTGSSTFTGAIAVDSVTDSSSTTTGSIQTDGGLGVAKAAYIGTTLNVASTTTLTGVATLTANPVLSAGTANGVAYLNGSKSLTSGTAFVFDGTNVGIGTSSNGTGTRLEVRAANTITDARGIASIISTTAAASNVGGSLSLGGETGQSTTPYVFGSIAGRYEGSNYSGYLQLSTTGSAGGITERMRIDSSGNVLINTTTAQTGAKLAVTGGIQGTITLGTAVASTSGTSIDFTSIPSWVKRITVMFNGVSTSGTNSFLVQIGSGSVTTTGYASSSTGASTAVSTVNSTSGFIIRNASAAFLFSGSITIFLVSSNSYVQSHTLKIATTDTVFGAGDVALSGALDRVRITTVGGTDTFDAGSINIMYEG
jgi:hypothetical protein